MSILCLESGGTKLVAAVADADARLLDWAQEFRPPAQTAAETLPQLAAMGRRLLAGQAGPPEAVAFGFGGPVQRSARRALTCYHESGWEAVDAVAYLSQAFQSPVFLENDCNLAALGEAHFGVQFTRGALFYMTVGTGIGGALVWQGRLLQTGDLGEAEIGHMVVDEDGPPCPCGNRGCLEALCAGPSLAALAQRLTGEPIESIALMDRFRKGDAVATRVIQAAAAYLGRALGSAITLLHPDVIVLGGGVMRHNAMFLEAIRHAAFRHTFPLFRESTRFVLSTLEEKAVCQGAAVYARQRLESRLS